LKHAVLVRHVARVASAVDEEAERATVDGDGALGLTQERAAINEPRSSTAPIAVTSPSRIMTGYGHPIGRARSKSHILQSTVCDSNTNNVECPSVT
jgi:hypothetical protein